MDKSSNFTYPYFTFEMPMNKPLLGTRPEPTRDVGERLRSLRVAAGLTQSDLAEGRFSKEYVSQIERGKTRPTAETLEWLAERLGVDPAYLGSGVSAEERGRVEAALARAEALLEQPDYIAAAREFEVGRAAVAATGAPDLELRSLLGETWALIQEGQMETAMPLLERARDLAERPTSSDVDRAAVLLRHGVMRYHRSSISTAVALLTQALELSPTAPTCRATCSAPTSSTGVPAATAASATGSRPARTSNGHSSSPIPPTTSAPPPRRTSRRRSSPSGRAAGCSRGRTRSGRAATTRSWTTGPRSAGC